jgi:transposase-like protein
MDRISNVTCTDVQADEIWGFIGKNEKNKGPEEPHADEIGDSYTWVAMERNTKLVLAFVVGRRTVKNAMELMAKVRRATSPDTRFQLTTTDCKPTLPQLMNTCLTVATMLSS